MNIALLLLAGLFVQAELPADAPIVAPTTTPAETYRSMSAAPTMMVFSKGGPAPVETGQGQVNAFVVFTRVAANGMASMEMTMKFDCAARTAAIGDQVAYRRDFSEVERLAPFRDPFVVETGNIMEPILEYACTNTIPEGSETFNSRDAAVDGAIALFQIPNSLDPVV